MKASSKRKPLALRPTKKRLTKGVFRQFNRKPVGWKVDAITAIVNSITRGGKGFLDIHDRVFISRIIVGKVVIIIIPGSEVRGWCGNEPHPFPPPLPPEPTPDGPYGPMPVLPFDRKQRQTVGSYLAAALKTHQGTLRLSTLANGIHTMPIGGQAILYVMGKL